MTVEPSHSIPLSDRRDARAPEAPLDPSPHSLRRIFTDSLHSRIGRRLLRAARVIASPREFAVRRAAARAVLQAADPGLHVDRRRGYVLFAPAAIPGVDEVLGDCRAVVREIRPHLAAIHASLPGKSRLTVDLFHDELHARQPGFVDFMLQDRVLLPAVEYLATVPFLSRVAMPHSIHVPYERPAYHQRFHVDNDDFTHLKLFLNVFDVDLADGPLSFLPADVSARVLRGLRRDGVEVGMFTTFSDEEVFRHSSPADVVRLEGPAGTAAFVDLSRCLHYGSRVEQGRERVMLAAAFIRYHRLHENSNSQLAPREGLDRLRTLALRTPRRSPRGYFCSDPMHVLDPHRSSAADSHGAHDASMS